MPGIPGPGTPFRYVKTLLLGKPKEGHINLAATYFSGMQPSKYHRHGEA